MEELVRFEWKHGGAHVLLAGTFTNWKGYPMRYHNGIWYDEVLLNPNQNVEFKFIVDGEWCYNKDLPVTTDKIPVNNVLPPSSDSHTSASYSSLLSTISAPGFVPNEGKLILTYAGLSKKDVDVIVKILKENPGLTVINLSNNNLEDETIQAISQVLPPSLQELHLWSTNIGDESVRSLSEVLENHPSLHTLQLRSNNIGPEGAKYLSNILTTNKNITILDLWWNPLEEQGLTSLAQGLQKNTTLREIHAGVGTVTGHAAKEWSKTLYICENLVDVHLFTNDRSPFKNTLEALGR